MAGGDLIAQPLGGRGGLNWVFLIELLVCGLLSLFFLFYFNRLFATIVSYIIRAYTWQRYKAYVDITSLQISLLGGRLFFKSLRYQAHNETILVHDGRITWRYWLRRVRDAEVYQQKKDLTQHPDASDSDVVANDEESGERPQERDLPCRIHIRVSGVEAFFYNHSPSYDHILSEVEAMKSQIAKERATHSADNSPDLASESTESKNESSHGHDVDLDIAPTISEDDGSKRSSQGHSLPSYLRFFPMQVECKKAAAAVGNENTRSIIVAKTDAATGCIDAGVAGPSDIFKLLFLFDLDKVSVSMRQNQDFQQLQQQAAAASYGDGGDSWIRPLSRWSLRVRSTWRKLVSVCSWPQSSSSSVRALPTRETGPDDQTRRPLISKGSWQGLARYLDDDATPTNTEWDDVEYARMTNLADLAKVSLKFYWDVAGVVPTFASEKGEVASESDPNGSDPPAYGLDLIVKNGTINYGPWTDRERIILQNVFFPASLVDARPHPRLKPGDNRLSTVFTMSFSVDGTVTARIPTREASKDYKWQSKAPATESDNKSGAKRRKTQNREKNKKAARNRADATQDKRPFGWLDITVAQDTVVHYQMDMYARTDGYHNKLRLQAKQPRITTSVNHDLLWKSGDIFVDGNLANPVSWNSLRTWCFDIRVDDLDLYILRDHMFLLTDVITDWASGAPPNYHTFVPFQYQLNVRFKDFNLWLGANDANLINRPTSEDDNSFLVLRGETLNVDFAIPIVHYRPAQNTFSFEIISENLGLDLLNPPRLTLCELLEEKRVGTLPFLTLKGSHTACADQSPDLTDTLQMEIFGRELCLTVFGYLLRYFVNFKDNYFGEFQHFRTFEEYQASGGDTSFAVREEREKYKFRRSNDLDVLLSIIIEKPTLLLPANLYSAKRHIRADLPMADVDLRVTNYYLDLQVDISPISFSFNENAGDDEDNPSSGEQLRLDGTIITGHRLFGLPPSEPAYVSTWDISAGDVYGACSTTFLRQAAQAGRSLVFALDDHENALPDLAALSIFDMTFLRVVTGSFEVAVDVDDFKLHLAFDPLELHFDDRADERFSAQLTTRLPNLTMACLTESSGSQERMADYETHAKDGTCLMFLQTTVDFISTTRKKDFGRQKKAQQDHIRKHDSRTLRANFLVLEDVVSPPPRSIDIPLAPPALSTPALPSNLPRADPPGSQQPRAMPNDTTKPKPFLQGNGGKAMTSAYLASLIPAQLSRDVFDDVPFLPASAIGDHAKSTILPFLYDPNPADEREQHQSIMITFVPGIKVLFRPEFTMAASKLASNLVPESMDDVMDAMQMSIIDEVERGLKRRLGEKSVIDISVHLPVLKLRALAGTDAIGRDAHHELDLSLLQSDTRLRLRTQTGDDADKTIKVLHTTLDRVSLDFHADTIDAQKSNAADVSLAIEDILLWSVLGPSNIVKSSFRVLTTSAPLDRPRDLAKAITYLSRMGESMSNTVLPNDNSLESRRRTVLHYISAHHAGISDPLYLSRMTYVLRAFPDHLRNQESWKMLARIRHAMQTLSPSQHEQLAKALLGRQSAKGRSKVSLDDLLSWCAWDIPGAHITCMYRLLADKTDEKLSPVSQQPLQLSLQAGLIRVLAGQGNRGSEVSFADLAVSVSIRPPLEPTGLMLVEDNLRTLITVSAHSSAIFMRLKWDLVSAAGSVIDVLDLRESPQKPTSARPKLSQLASFDTPASKEDFHFVFSTDTGTAIIDTIHLQHISEVRNLQISLIGTSRAGRNYGNCLSLLASSDRATTELHTQGSYSHKIWRTDIVEPAFYIDFRHRMDPKATELNIGGTYQEMIIKLQQEPIAIVSVVNRVIDGEVMQIRDISERINPLKPSPEAEDEPDPFGKAINTLEINAALLAGTFDVSFAVLQSLSLNVRGNMTNIRMKPRRIKHTPLDIEVDVGPIRFAAISKESRLAGSEALFHTPATATSVEVLFTDQLNSIRLSSEIKEMQIEFAAVQNILTLLRRKEVQSAVNTLEHNITDLQRKVKAITGAAGGEVAPKSRPGKPTKYSVNLELAGFKIKARAPVQKVGADSAELIFGLGLVHIEVNNGYDQDSPADTLPEVYARLESIYARLALLSPNRKKACGHAQVGFVLRSSLPSEHSNSVIGDVHMSSDTLNIEISAETASTVVDIVTHVQKKLVDLDLSKEVEYMKRIRNAQTRAIRRHSIAAENNEEQYDLETLASMAPSNLVVSLTRIRLTWVTADDLKTSTWQPEDLEFSLARVEFSLRQRNQAKLTIESLQLQMIPKSFSPTKRSMNSALLPEMIFMVKFDTSEAGINLAFQAVGQAVDFHLDAGFAGPLGLLVTSGKEALDKYREASKNWYIISKTEPSNPNTSTPFGTRRLASLSVDVSFAGGILYLRGKAPGQPGVEQGVPIALARSNSAVQTTLRAPGISMKLEYLSDRHVGKDASLTGEIRVDASSNTVYPELVPIVLQISDNAKVALQQAQEFDKKDEALKKGVNTSTKTSTVTLPDESMLKSNELLARTRISFGLRICKQEFGLSCQPIARVNAKVEIEDIYISLNTLDSSPEERFLAIAASLSKFRASVQHVYSRDSTFSFDIDSVNLSVMNSKHLDNTSAGITAILKIEPMKTSVNARQLQDLLLFREIWLPEQIRKQNDNQTSIQSEAPEEFLVQRYRQVAAAAAFPWTAIVALYEVSLDIDFGQGIGKSSINIRDMWASSTKTSDWKQELCIGITAMDAKSVGRMGGSVELADLGLRTLIEWPVREATTPQTPLVQATAGFHQLKLKAAFDYQPFAFADLGGLSFLMYNLQEASQGDRLVAALDLDHAYAYTTATSPAQALGLYQAFDRLIQEKRAAFKESVDDIQKQLQRPSSSSPYAMQALQPLVKQPPKPKQSSSLRLGTDSVVRVQRINVGVYPGTFFDSQVLKLEAGGGEARFLVDVVDSRVHSDLRLVMGQLQVALAGAKRVKVPKSLSEIPIEEIIENGISAKGGIIVRVPRLVASMQTWQSPDFSAIDYIFKSTFEGKVDVGFNYSRISFIRTMWDSHTRALAARLGKPLPESAVSITTGPEGKNKDGDSNKDGEEGQGKITAVVNMPISKYEYRALEPPIIETPQLRDMGEATPPLEWIGLQRDKLPNVVHQVIIVALLEFVKEVEDAYARILGSS